jgi:SAM-dependent methyltransferase
VTPACWACGATTVAPVAYGALALHRCGSCGLLFDPDRSPGVLQALYTDAYFEDRDRGAALLDDERSRRHEARLRVDWVHRHRQDGRLLEIGAGAGYFLAEAAARSAFSVSGIEPAERVAAESARRFSVDVTAGFVEDAVLPGHAYDLVCGWHVLEHLSAPAGTLDRLRGALRPGGLLFVEVPNVAGVTATAQGASWPALDPQHHVAHYGPRSLRALLERSGFRVLELTSFPSARYYRPRQVLWPGMWATLARQAWALRAPPRRPHPWKQDLLRAVAVAGDRE